MSKKMATNFIRKMDFWNLRKNAKDEKKMVEFEIIFKQTKI